MTSSFAALCHPLLQDIATGTIAGYPMQDISVTVYDGKHHSVDSKEVTFVRAGRKSFLDAISKGVPIVMEPIVDATIAVPPHCVGGVLGRRQLHDGLQPLCAGPSGNSFIPRASR